MQLQYIWKLFFFIISYINGHIKITTFRRISSSRGSLASCSITCARDPTCSGYLLGQSCIEIAAQDVHTTCLSINPRAPCYRKNNFEVLEPTTLEQITTDFTTVIQFTTIEAQPNTPIPQGCVESLRQSFSGSVYVTYHEEDTSIKFASVSKLISRVTGGSSTKSVGSYYPDFPSDIADMYKVNVGSTEYMMVIDGKSVETVTAKKLLTTMLTYPWKCTVLHCNHLGNTWKPLVLTT